MVVLTLALFGDTLLVPYRVPGTAVSDLRIQYLYWRSFAFDQIRAGHFPLWNPYVFCGTPFFGDPQSAMLYPPNWLNLIFSVELAASVLTISHFFLAGWLAGVWCRRRGCGAFASIIAAVTYSCSGPIITNLLAGHVPLLCSAAWLPLLLICADEILSGDNRRVWKWTLVGISVVTLLAVNGYTQFAYDSALTVGLYVLLQLPQAPRRGQAIVCTMIMFAGGWIIAAAQIVPSAAVTAESVRSGGMSIATAGQFSLPPENLLTMLVPGLFGDDVHLKYFGRWNWWETCVFVGPAVLTLAVYGAMQRRKMVVPAVMAVVLMIVALGSYLPVFTILYHCLPGFDHFRAPNRFSLPAILFVALLAANGWDQLSLIRKRAWLAPAGLMIVSAIVFVIFGSRFAQVLGSFGIQCSNEMAANAARQLYWAAGVAGLTALCWFFSNRNRWPRAGLALLAIGQLVFFGFEQQVRSDAFVPIPDEWKNAIAATPAGGRIVISNDMVGNSGAPNGFLNAIGYNPLILRRTAAFLGAVQGQDAEGVGLQYVIHGPYLAYRMLRCAWVTTNLLTGNVYPLPRPLPQLKLLGTFTAVNGPDAALAMVLQKSFDPEKKVVLETPPSPLPVESSEPAGMIRVLSQTTDDVEIEADLVRPQVLLVTDAYSKDWRVDPLSGDTQGNYEVQPGDYCLRAIPLAAGRHHFRMAYRPASIVTGAMISLIAIAIYLGAIVFYRHTR